MLCGALMMAACTTPGGKDRSPVRIDPGTAIPSGDRPATSATDPVNTVERMVGRWHRAHWSDIPGRLEDFNGAWLPPLLAGCHRMGNAWHAICREAASLDPLDATAVRTWMEQRLDVWRIEDSSTGASGLLTGYFEPHFEARRTADETFKFPLYAPPPDLSQRRPYWTRQEMESIHRIEAQMRPLIIAFLRSPIDVLVMQVQGSGRLTITEADESRREVRLRFAGHNDHPYRSVPRALMDRGWITPAQAHWPALREWAQRNPSRAQEGLWANPRVVFFRQEALERPEVGASGALGIPLTPERSVAVDPRSIPLGTPLWMSADEGAGPKPLQRWVVAQDTGAAITGAVRADYFWGWGPDAERMANRTRMALRLWALWPKGLTPPP